MVFVNKFNSPPKPTSIVFIPYRQVLRQTENAWLFEFDDSEVWLPRSQCSLVRKQLRVGVPRWLAEKHDLIEKFV